MNLTEPIRHDPEKRSFQDWYNLEIRRRQTRLRKLYSIKDPEVKKKALRADYWACKEDVLYWIEQYGWVISPGEKESLREIPFILFDKQVELVKKLQEAKANKHPIIVNKGRELGVSWCCLFDIAHDWRFGKSYSAKLGSRKEILVDDGTLDSLFGKIRSIFTKQPWHLKPNAFKDNSLLLKNNANQCEIVGEATNPGFGRGGRKTVILFDEFAHVLPNIQAQCWMSVDTVADSIFIVSTPNGKANKFAMLLEELPEEYKFEIFWQANPYRGPEWKEIKLQKMSDDEFEQEHEGSLSAVRFGKIWTTPKDQVSYNEFSNEWIEHKDAARKSWYHIGGWDFGSGPSLTCCLYAVINWKEDEQFPDIWIDDEDAWKSTEWQRIANDARIKIGKYSGSFVSHFGDPASKNRESDSSSWLLNLQSAGIPLSSLPSNFNTREGIDTAIKIVQWYINSNKLRIHERCEGLWSAMDSWQYDIPQGIPLELVNKEWIQPKKDLYSHYGNALMYLVLAVYTYMKRGKKDPMSSIVKSLHKLPKSTLAEMLDRAKRA
jgi:hypothetical protein